MPAKRRRFGKVRKLPSGRFQASYVGPDGQRRTAPDTFRTKTDADRWLAATETDLHRGGWVDDALGRTTFGNYARGWLRDSPKIGARWRETCLRNLRLHLAPLADLPLRAITPGVVRDWYGTAMRGTGGKTSIAQSYRFLRAVMNAAVREGAILRNPCTIPGAGADRAKERPTATPAQIVQLVEAITPRYRAAVLIAAWGGLRRGEIIGLSREDATAPNCSKRPSPMTRTPSRRPASEHSVFRRTSSRSWPSTWRSGPVRNESSLAAQASRCAVTLYVKRSRGPGQRSAWKASASTTSAIPARRWLPRPAHPSQT